MSFLGKLFDPAGITTGNAGDIVNNSLDPAGGIADNLGIWQPTALSDWHDQTGNYFDDINSFESFQLGDWANRLKDNPFKFLVAGTPASTKIWNKALNKDWDPAINQFGGPAKETYQRADEAGRDTANSRGSHQVAQAIASYEGGGYLSDAGSAYFGGSAAGGGAVAGGALGGANALDNDTSLWEGIGTGALGGAVGGGMDYGDGVGITDPQYKKLFNNGVTGGVKAGINKGNVGQGIGKGLLGAAVPMAAQQGGNMLGGLFDDMPNEGTLGGNMRDEYGENTATMQAPTPTQNNANVSAGLSAESSPMGLRNIQSAGGGGRESSPVDSFIASLTGGGGGGLKGNYGAIGANLLGLYQANQQRKKYGQQMDGLSNLFTPNSPYAQQMRQTLERKDAAAGRRSQYGPREAQLAAQLAIHQSNMAPQLMALQKAQSGASNQMINNGLQGLGSLYKQAPNIQQDWGSLTNMFGGQ